MVICYSKISKDELKIISPYCKFTMKGDIEMMLETLKIDDVELMDLEKVEKRFEEQLQKHRKFSITRSQQG